MIINVSMKLFTHMTRMKIQRLRWNMCIKGADMVVSDNNQKTKISVFKATVESVLLFYATTWTIAETLRKSL